MSVLALKGLSYGAEKIPDRLFEKIPLAGGFFTPEERKNIEKKRHPDRERRNKSEQRRSERDRRRAERDRTPPTEYSGHSDYDSDYERERRRKDRRHRARSLGRSISRSPSRGRRSRGKPQDLDDEMDRAERAERAPRFDPPPGQEYKPYDPRDFAPGAPVVGQTPTGVPVVGSTVADGYSDPYDRRASSAVPEYGYSPQPRSATAAKYTPAGYAPSPMNAPIPPPSQVYAPYNPADYATPRGPEAGYAAPPPFHRQRSNSQPPMPQYAYPNTNTQLATYVEPVPVLPVSHGSSAPSHRRRHGDGKHHRARSAGHHGRSQDSVTDKFRDRFENMDMHDKNLAASVGGALAGGFAGQKMGHGTLSTLIGAGIGAFGGRELEKRLDKSRTRDGSRAPQDRSVGRKERSHASSRDRRRDSRRDDYDSYSDSESDDRRGPRRKRGGSRRSPDRYD